MGLASLAVRYQGAAQGKENAMYRQISLLATIAATEGARERYAAERDQWLALVAAANHLSQLLTATSLPKSRRARNSVFVHRARTFFTLCQQTAPKLLRSVKSHCWAHWPRHQWDAHGPANNTGCDALEGRFAK
jgi:hypothetical protein